MGHFVITIGRQIGAGGLEIARKLSSDLGVKMYDRDLISEFAHHSGLRSELFEQRDEKPSHLKFGSFFGLRSTMQGNNTSDSGLILSDEKIFEIQSEIIKRIAENESCIIVGRCSDYILRDCPYCMNVFVTADMKDRIPRIMELDKMTESQARRYIEHGDKKRAKYYNYYTFKTWGDSSSYDLCIDSSRLGGIERTAEAIKTFMNIYFQR